MVYGFDGKRNSMITYGERMGEERPDSGKGENLLEGEMRRKT
jgi:hypothetical protein